MSAKSQDGSDLVNDPKVAKLLERKSELVVKIRELKTENAKLGHELLRLGVSFGSQPSNWN